MIRMVDSGVEASKLKYWLLSFLGGFVPSSYVTDCLSCLSYAQKKSNYNNGKRRMNSRTSMAQREDVIRRTVYVSDIDHQVNDPFCYIFFTIWDA